MSFLFCLPSQWSQIFKEGTFFFISTTENLFWNGFGARWGEGGDRCLNSCSLRKKMTEKHEGLKVADSNFFLRILC